MGIENEVFDFGVGSLCCRCCKVGYLEMAIVLLQSVRLHLYCMYMGMGKILL